MQLIVLAGPGRAPSLEACLPDVGIIGASKMADCLRAVRSLPADGILIHVSSLRYGELPALRELEAYRSVPIILWGRLSPILASAAIDVARWSHPTIVMEDIEDDPDRIRTFLSSLPPARTREALARRLAPQLARLPLRMQGAFNQVWHEPARDASMKRLAARSGYSPRRVYALLRAAGFSTPHCLLDARRLVDAWAYARDPGFTLTEVARKSGQATIRAFRRLCERLAESGSRDRLVALDEQAMIDRVVARLLTP